MSRISSAKWMEKYKRWQINVQKFGLRKSFYSSKEGRSGQRECHKKADEWLNGITINGDTKIGILYFKWLAEIETVCGKSYYSNNKGYWNNWMEAEIGSLRICDVKEQHLQNILNRAFSQGKSKKTIKNMRGCMVSFIKYCRKSVPTTLSTDNIVIPRNAKPPKKHKILQSGDLNLLFNISTTLFRNKIIYEPLIYAFRFQVATGIRSGELLGLEWSDIDFENKVVSLKRSINSYKDITTGKNDNSRREFILTDMAYGVLREHLLVNGKTARYIFSSFGNYTNPCTYYDRWIKYRNENGLTKCTLHELRHTFISVVKTLPDSLIKNVVGHSVNMDTYGIYGHEIDGEKKKTALLIQAEFEKLGVKYNTL